MKLKKLVTLALVGAVALGVGNIVNANEVSTGTTTEAGTSTSTGTSTTTETSTGSATTTEVGTSTTTEAEDNKNQKDVGVGTDDISKDTETGKGTQTDAKEMKDSEVQTDKKETKDVGVGTDNEKITKEDLLNKKSDKNTDKKAGKRILPKTSAVA